MIHSLEVTASRRPEVVERILRVTRHRGFTLTGMQMRINNDASVSLDMEVDSDRGIELLCNQLAKLFDVRDCRVLPALPQIAQAART